jgi:hypothetical protein
MFNTSNLLVTRAFGYTLLADALLLVVVRLVTPVSWFGDVCVTVGKKITLLAGGVF